MRKKRYYQKIDALDIMFILLLALLVSINAWWILNNKYAPMGDGLDIINEALNIHYEGTGYSITIPYLSEPPFMAKFFNIFYSLFGIYTKKELLIDSIFLAILLIGTYKLGGLIYNKKTGLLSSLIIASFFAVITISKSNFREFYLLSALPITLSFLIKTDKFRAPGSSLIFGISLGICALVENSFILLIVPPVIIYAVYCLISCWREDKKRINPVVRNIALAAIISFLIGGIWYMAHFKDLLSQAEFRLNNKAEYGKTGAPPMVEFFLPFSWIIGRDIGILFGILFILAIIRKLITKKTIAENLLLVSFFVPLMIISLLPIKSDQVARPLYYPIAILIADFILALNPRKIRIATLSPFLIYCFIIIFSQAANIYVFNPAIENGQLRLVRSNTLNRGLSLPNDDISLIEKTFLFTYNNSSLNSTFLLLSNDHVHFWELLYYRNTYKKYYRVYAKYRLENSGYYQWLYDSKIAGGFDFDFNIENLIETKKIDWIVMFLPRDYGNNSAANYNQLNYYKPSFDASKLASLRQNYILAGQLTGNMNTEEKGMQVLLYKKLS